MKKCVEHGLDDNEHFSDVIKITKKAKIIMNNLKNRNQHKESHLFAMAYAYGVAELNVMGGEMVTAPTLGSAGVIPGVFYYAYKNRDFEEEKIYEALAIAGLVGNCFKHNGSIAGATGGCQAEIGVACAMAAAGYCHLLGGTLKEIEAAAIIAMEHLLGLTCDPILGYVYSPCIERNGALCIRGINAAEQSILTNGLHDIFDLDDIVAVELQTGKDLKDGYRETGKGGLALRYSEKYLSNK
jgi:L-serine dehydratase